MPASVCCNRHAHDFAAFGSPCPDCGALLRFRTRYVAPEKTRRQVAAVRRVGCMVLHPDIPGVSTAANFYEFSLRNGFDRARLAKRLAERMLREHPVWGDAATDAAFALACCRDEIERDALLQAARRRAVREKKRQEQLFGV